MVVKGRHKQVGLVWVILLARLRAAAASEFDNLALPGCRNNCGDVQIPYPFGVGNSSITSKKCFLKESFELTCNNSKLWTGNVQVLNISLSEGNMDISFLVSHVCFNASLGRLEGDTNHEDAPILQAPALGAFTISSKHNKFITVGCDSYGYLNSFQNGITYSTGCLTKCDRSPAIMDKLNNGSCSGIGCCQVDVPLGMKNISIQAYTFKNFTYTHEFNRCSYTFVAKQGSFNFHRGKIPDANYPLVVDWAVGDEKCKARPSTSSYACKNNSYCEPTESGNGYRCRCKKGYEGNPYHPNGCRDINECTSKKHNCISEQNCRNTDGSFHCFCSGGQSGNGTKEGGCRRKQGLSSFKIAIGAMAVFVAPFVGISWLYLIYKKRKLIKLREKFFRQNGGILLQQQLSARDNSSQAAQIFTAKELEKATKNYDESLIIGKGGFGTVFKGVLADNTIVAIKKSKVLDQSQIKQFVNEVIVLSQINHRNVVKLLGCCLETKVPLLVYEFVNHGTLFDYLHNKSKATNVCWKTRLRIATEAAGALSYLHSAASIPIIHRDVKTTNILLDENYTVKVSDFGASKLVPLDENELATMVQGTFGYLDPEYMRTSQLTVKSDVYSFGVVLAELLTGEKAVSFERPEERRNLAMHFPSCLNEDCLYEVLESGILNEGNKEEVRLVATLAAKCLMLKGEERPSMKEVAMELEGIRTMAKHPSINEDLNFNIMEKTRHFLHESSGTYEYGDNSNFQNTGHDSMIDHVEIDFDNGR